MAASITITVTDLSGVPVVGVAALVTPAGTTFQSFQGFRRTPGGAARDCGPAVAAAGPWPQPLTLAAAGLQDQPGNYFWSVRGLSNVDPPHQLLGVDDAAGHAHVRTAGPHGIVGQVGVVFTGTGNVVYEQQSWDASPVDATTFQLVGNQTYNGPVTGGFWAPVGEVSGEIDSPEVFACASPVNYSTHSRCIDSIQRRLVALNLPVIGERVYTRKGFMTNQVRHPCLVLSIDEEQERDLGGTTGSDDWSFPVKAEVVARQHDAPVLDELYLFWRQQIRSLHPGRLDDVPGSWKTLFDARWVVRYVQQEMLYMTSLAILRCVVRTRRP